jgi:hypothetical protein
MSINLSSQQQKFPEQRQNFHRGATSSSFNALKLDNQRERNKISRNIEATSSCFDGWLLEGGNKTLGFCNSFNFFDKMPNSAANSNRDRRNATMKLEKDEKDHWRRAAAREILNPVETPNETTEETVFSLNIDTNISKKNLVNEPRIVAPNVAKLSPRSAVEIKLQSECESVTILCSTDVLKMSSLFFENALNEQDEDEFYKSHDNTNDIWREPILLVNIRVRVSVYVRTYHYMSIRFI